MLSRHDYLLVQHFHHHVVEVLHSHRLPLKPNLQGWILIPTFWGEDTVETFWRLQRGILHLQKQAFSKKSFHALRAVRTGAFLSGSLWIRRIPCFFIQCKWKSSNVMVWCSCRPFPASFLTRKLCACARASCRYDVRNGTRSLARSLYWPIPVNFFSILGFWVHLIVFGEQ